MAGKRLLDAAKLVNACTSIAKQHFVLRRQQWDVYSQTSTLAKAVKNQTDRVTVTAAAAFELAKRFSETSPQWQQGRWTPGETARQEEQREARQTYDGSTEATDATVAEAAAQQAGKSINVQAETAQPTVDTTRAPAVEVPQEQSQDDGTLSSLRKRELQRQAERQIPATTADTQPETAGGQDTFTERTTSASPQLSSLPRSKIPKHMMEAPESDQPVPSMSINEDVYPMPREGQQPAETDTPEGVNTDIYSSPRVSRMLGKTGSNVKNPYAGRQKLPPKPLPEMVAAREGWQKQQEVQAQPTPTPQSSPAATGSASVGGDAETQNLIASIAEEAEVCPDPPDQPSHTDMLTSPT